MKKIVLILSLTALIKSSVAQSSVNWDDIISGTPSVFRKYNVCSLTVFKNDVVLKTVSFDKKDNAITFLNASRDTLYRLEYDGKDRIHKVTRTQRELTIRYWENDTIVKSLTMATTKNPSVDTVQITSFPYRKQSDIVQNEWYVTSKISSDTLSKSKIINGYIINPIDSTLNYVWEVNNEKEIKKYPNQDWKTATTTCYGNYYSYDSTVPFNDAGKRKYYHYRSLVYPDSTIQTIIKDTTYSLKIINGKLVYKKLSFRNKDIIEVFYNEDSTIGQKILYKYYPTKRGDSVLWKKITINAVGKKLKTEYPNKSRYKKRKGILIVKKRQPKVILQNCADVTLAFQELDDKMWLISTSLFFDYDVEGNADRNYNLNLDVFQKLYLNNIFKDEYQLYYAPCLFVYGNKDSLNNSHGVDFKMKKITVPPKESIFVLNSNKNKYQIKLIEQDRLVMMSPIYSEKQIVNLQHDVLLIVFQYLKRYIKP